jgi:hypothetical protein
MSESFNIKVPPKFTGINFPIWKIKMSVFLKSLGRDIHLAIENEFKEPKEFDDAALKAYEANAKATYALMQALNDDDLSRIIYCKSAYEIWNSLITTHEGTSQVKRAKIDLLMTEYENFAMLDNEAIDDMLTRFNNITNGLISLGEEVTNDQKVRKVIRSLPKAWEVKSTTLKELNDAKEMNFTVFMGNLKTHEMEMKARKSREPQKEKGIAFKINQDESDDENEGDLVGSDEFSLLVRNVARLLYKRGNFKRGKWQGKDKKERDSTGPCYKCNKYGHLMADCPIMVATSSSSKKPNKKKAFQVTWDDSESESEEEQDKANMCFMAGNEVNSNPEDELTFDDLAYAFEELEGHYKTLKSRHAKLKKEHDKLVLEHDILLKEKDRIFIAHNKIQEDLNSHMSSCSSKSVKVPINRKEIDEMKTKINELSSTFEQVCF